jgi:cytochrome c oxidase assembly protein subunit 15
MSVPDWPNTYGYNMFYFPFSQWIGGIFWEHSHRLMASLVGLMTLILTIWSHGRTGRSLLRYGILPLSVVLTLLVLINAKNNTLQHASITGGIGIIALFASFLWPRMKPASKLTRRLCWIALLMVIGQGLLGGLRVTLYKDEIGIIHATLAQLFLVLLVSITFVSSKRWTVWRAASKDHQAVANRFSWIMCALCVLVVCQLILGAFMRHEHAGLAVTGFPLAYDQYLWPPTHAEFVNQLNVDRMDHRDFNPITALHVQVHMLHRSMALILFIAASFFVGWSLKYFGRQHLLGRLSILWFSLLCLQAFLGVATVWSNKAADIATTHVLIGALTLALGSFMVVAARRSVFLAKESKEAKATRHREMPDDLIQSPEVAVAKG